VEIRRATPREAARISELEALIFSDPWSERSITDTISLDGSMCYVALSDGEVAAYLLGRVIPPEGEIYRIATAPEKRKRGIAYRLLDYAVKCERGRGLESLFLEVRSQNAPARALYKAYGFREIGIRKRYYKSPEDDAIIMLHAHDADMI
jgi:ribosomal-protein-alanine N-acetyltransferase